MTFKVGDLIRIKEERVIKWNISPDSLVNYLIVGRQHGWKPLEWDDRGLVDCDREFFKLLTPDEGICFESVVCVHESYEHVK